MSWLDESLERLNQCRVAVFGDFCLDAYWLIGADDSELSVETQLPVRRVRSQRYSLGGAGNVTANLVDLGVGEVRAITLAGADLFGRHKLDLLNALGVDTRGVLQTQESWQTLAYSKPCIGEAELNRIDFGGFNRVEPGTMDLLAEQLDRAAGAVDVIVLNQQVPSGVSPPKMIDRINEIIASHPDCQFIADSRHRAEMYRGAILKLNAHEAARICGQPRALDERIPVAQVHEYATALFERGRKPVFITRGENGIVVCDEGGLQEVPGIQILQKVDSVGAGDTVVSALAASLAAGSDGITAARLANIAASVTVRKLQTTGTASPDEIRRVGPYPSYVYLPELADDPRQARIIEGTEIEIVRDLSAGSAIRHAIFDHDGTLSTLREGWEQIMGPTMVRAVLGPRYQDADEALYHKVVDRVNHFIDKTTGVQTLVQMQGLVEMVREFGCVAPEDILDMHGYKAVYNEQLLVMVHQRIEKFHRGELSAEDFQLKNAHPLLEALRARGVKLYLASGTDQADVIAESEALGYAHLFEGRIFGAVGDITVEAKRDVLERIIRENDLNGPQLVTFGDGPVEIRETRKRDGITVGVASDEVRRFGLNLVKRSRLIRAGADMIVPDFSQLDRLLAVLGLGE